jgi:hypothetical protein
MSHQTWQEVLVTAQSNGTAVTGTTIGSLLPPQAKFTLPANFFDYVGKSIRVRASGQMSNIVTTPGTLTFTIRFGASTAVAVSSAYQLVTTAKTNVSWYIDLALEARVIGTSAALLPIGEVTGESFQSGAGVANIAGTAMWPLSAPANGTAFDSTVSQVVDMLATFSLTGNSVQLMQYALETMN